MEAPLQSGFSGRVPAPLGKRFLINCVTWVMFCAVGCAADGGPTPRGGTIVHPAPPDAPKSLVYQLTVDERPVFVYDARIDEPRNNAFASFDMSAPVRVTVTVPAGFKSVKVRPRSAGVTPQVNGNSLSFTLNKPVKLSIELNGGTHYPLFLFANPPEVNVPKEGDANVRYFGPGIHSPGKIVLKSNETLYIAGGAIVRAPVAIVEAQQVVVRGRGILDGHDIKGEAIHIEYSRDVLVEGVTLTDQPANSWAVTTWTCDDVRFENIKIMTGDPPFSNDGIDLVSSQRCVVRDSFVKAHDDAISIKSIDRPWQKIGPSTLPTRRESKNILVEGCLVWATWAHALQIGAELNAPSISDITFRNCDLIHVSEYGTGSVDYYGAMGIFNVDDGVVSNILFEDIRVENMYAHAPRLVNLQIPLKRWSRTKEFGSIRGVTFRNIQVFGQIPVSNLISGRNPEHRIEDVTFENLSINGKVVTSLEGAVLNADERTTRNIRVIATGVDKSQLAPTVKSALRVVSPFPTSSTTSRAMVRLTLQNADAEMTADGQVLLVVVPANSQEITPDARAKVAGDPQISFSLKVGEQVTKDVQIEAPLGQYVLLALPQTPGVALSRIPLAVPGSMSRVPAIENPAAVNAALAKEPAQTAATGGQTLGTIRFAIAGENVAICATVFDDRIKPGLNEWPDGAVDVMVSVPGTNVVRQVVFQPSGPTGGKVTLHENGKEITPIPSEVPWQVKPLATKGYELQALIPLALFKVDATVERLLLECAIAATPAGETTVRYAPLFKSVGGYQSNVNFAEMWVR